MVYDAAMDSISSTSVIQAAMAMALVCACRFDTSGVAAAAGDDGGPTPDAITADANGVSVFCDAANPDIVACYQFDDSTGTDLSQYNNDLTTTDNVTYALGVSGLALETGANSDVSAAESASLDVAAFTIEMWVAPAELPTSNRMGLLDNNGQYGLFLDTNDIVRCSAGVIVETTYALPLDQWTHIACTVDADTLAVWINGSMAASTDSDAVSTGGGDGTAIGMNSPWGDNFIGKLDDLRVWRVVRTPEEICASASPACTL
jgi:hypothetical protein